LYACKIYNYFREQLFKSPKGDLGVVLIMQIVHSTSTSPAFNLAAEEFLFSERQDDVLFLYVNEPSVIIGCNQAIRNEVDLAFCAENDIQVVRRKSGGGAVFHDLGNLNFCFISNKSNTESSLNADFLNPIVQVLMDLGIPVKIGKRKDLWLEEKFKITGTASHVAHDRELHHGTLLYDTNLELLERTLASKEKDENVTAIASVRSTVKNLRSYLEVQDHHTLSDADFFELFYKKLLQYYKLTILSHFSDVEINQIQLLETCKYRLKEWTFKK
jgi:lipoate---protein ligase